MLLFIQELEQIPLFMTKTPSTVDPDKSPGLAALQALKYETETAEGRATAHKEEGRDMTNDQDNLVLLLVT